MKMLKKLFSIVYKIIFFPCFLLILVLDYSVANRIISKRFSFRDVSPHLYTVIFGSILFLLKKFGILSIEYTSNFPDLIGIFLNFQAILFATSLAVSTFILSIFKPNELIKQYPEKKEIILDIVDDLRIANKIIFFVLIYIFFIGLLEKIKIINISINIFIITLAFLFWSILSIYSIIRGIFYFVRI